MINLNRSKENKWIMQKNISSSDLLEAFVSGMQNQNNIIDSEYLVNYLRNTNTYHGRSETGSTNTMGVRLSQACFYMFGFKKDGNFYPSPMTELYLNKIATTKYYFINCSKLESDIGAETIEYQKDNYYLLIVGNNNCYEIMEIKEDIDDLADYAKTYDVSDRKINSNKREILLII